MANYQQIKGEFDKNYRQSLAATNQPELQRCDEYLNWLKDNENLDFSSLSPDEFWSVPQAPVVIIAIENKLGG